MTYYNNINRPPSQLPGTLVDDLVPGESSLSTLDCGNDVANPTMSWTTDAYAFAESYSVWGWAKNTGVCD